jgi:glucose-6-phosphate isomerase
VLENVDPGVGSRGPGRIDPRRVLVNVVSKSGATAETLAQYLVVRHWLEAAVGPDAASHHMVFTTDPERGALRQIAARENIPALEVPPEIGGRFSVLSPVGLLPAALVGIDIEALLRGARRALRRAESSRLLDNPAALYSALLWARMPARGTGARPHALLSTGCATLPSGIASSGRRAWETGQPFW